MRLRSGALAAASFITFLAAGASLGVVQAADPVITAAPAFTPQQLLAQPRNAWVTNGGTLYNQRYSPLSLINRDNVKNLRALWRTGMGSGTTPGHAGQAQILAYEGVLYVVNGAIDEFALDVETGAILWKYEARPDLRAGSPIGRASRGLGLGDGRIYVGVADGRLIALDQRTGNPVWEVQAERWQDGYAITAAPLYFDGKVIMGMNGGEMGTRGRNNMPTFKDVYDVNQIRDVSEFITTVLPKGAGATK